MNREEQLLISRILKYASEKMSMNGCNDTPADLWKGWSRKEKEILVKNYEDWNSKGQDYVKGEQHILNYDWIVLIIFSRIIESREKLSFKEKKIISYLLNIAGNDIVYREERGNGKGKIPKEIWGNLEKEKVNIILDSLKSSEYFFECNLPDLTFYYSNIIINRKEKIQSIISNI